MFARATAAPAHHGALVRQPDGSRPPAQAGRDHARNLGRHVRPERSDLAGLGLHEAQHVGRVERSEAPLENLGELEHGRRDHRVAVQGEPVQNRPRQRPPGGGLFWQQVAHARGKRVL